MVVDETLIQTVAQQIAQAASGPCRVILFGSHARGDAGPDSDLDFLVIAEEVGDRHAEMARLGHAVRELGFPVDVVVISEAYADEWEQVPNTLVHAALCEGWEVAARPQDVAADIRQARDQRTARIRRAVREAGGPRRGDLDPARRAALRELTELSEEIGYF